MAFGGDEQAIADINAFIQRHKPGSNLTVQKAFGGESAPATATRIRDTNKETPISSLDDDPMGYRYISYPRDVTRDKANGHYMLFYVNVQNKASYGYESPDGKPVGSVVEYEIQQGNPNSDAESSGKFGYARQASDPIAYQDAFNRVAKGGKGNNLSQDEIFLTPNSRYANSKYGQSGGVGTTFKTTTRITDSVALYLPPNVQDNTSATYNDLETGIVGLVAAGGGQFLDAMKRNDYQRAASQLIGGVKAVSQQAFQTALGGLVDVFAGVEGSAQLANKAFGQATNPYMEVMFESMGLREFTYNFTFAPKNAQERDDVQDIIKLFRFHMAPELKGSQHRFLTLPSTFDIHYMYQHDQDYASENNFYSKIATCVLQSVSVDYSPNGVKSFQDGSPTQINMALAFKETELLTKQAINAGY